MKSAELKEQNYQFKTNINMETKTSILAVTKAFFILLVMVSAFSCKPKPCDKIDKKFRPHKVVHCNKSKVYIYYHNTPCDCNSIQDDLCLDCYYQKTYKDYVEFYDNRERIYGR